ncbi:YrdB family protein [Streptacidiphilus anmyonensis]|uniref:YrdB family protein n=1 Tax=Streptacidiphilus anmyonensis TaxID=405782 RepID=UPI0005A91A9F|nr:YrdB family protein [Streptacidiphilus anmyonensis]
MIPKPLHHANELLAFLLELVALGGLAWWGFRTGQNAAVHVLLGVGAPLAMAVLWGMFAAPRARHPLPVPALLVFKLVVFGLAAAALYAVGAHAFGIVFAVVAVANTVLATADRESLARRTH